jgi:predicted Zn-dependent protease
LREDYPEGEGYNRGGGMKGRVVIGLVLMAMAAVLVDAWAGEDVLLKAMNDELSRSIKSLKGEEYAPLYYLQYEVFDIEERTISAVLGAIQTDDSERSRFLDVALRVGDYALDNTHEIRGRGGGGYHGANETRMPLVDDYDALRASIWLATDEAFKDAQERYIRVKQDKAVKVEEEDPSPDFSPGKGHVYTSDHSPPQIDSDEWRSLLKEVSARFREYDHILTSRASLSTESVTKYIVDSEGSKLKFSEDYIRVSLFGNSKADDGMRLYRSRSYHVDDLGEAPSKEALFAGVDSIADELDRLRDAPIVEPYIGPAILMGKASGVFFHEIFGHRIEGHRQKSSESGQTFTKKVGEEILPPFISIYDDPTIERFKGTVLRGYYPYDDEGVPSERVTVVENGILKNFLMSRSPISGFATSNGHGRKQQGRNAVSRQGNLIIQSTKTMSPAALRDSLIAECERQGKPYGLVFEDISGGFTMMGRRGPQAFKVIPLLVYRVYADGRPDEVVRGVDIVGTPLTCFAKITATGDDDDIFNGTCGAESGWVPVSAVSPSILVSEIEVEKKSKEQDKPPVLARPSAQAPGISHDPVMKAMEDELARSLDKLKMEELETPYYVEYTVRDVTSVEISASFGALTSSDEESHRDLSVDLRVGDYSFDNTNYVAGGPYGFSFNEPDRVVSEDDYSTLRHQLWMATDDAYKSALEAISQKRAYIQTRHFEEMPDDMSKLEPHVDLGERAELKLDRDAWNEKVAKISAVFRNHPGVTSSSVTFTTDVTNQYFANTEGFRHQRPSTVFGLEVTASAQADDGMELNDFLSFYSRTEDGLPPVGEIEKKVQEMAKSLEKRAQAPVAEDYVGPVLFMGQASAEFFGQLLGQNVSNPRGPLTENEMMQQMIPGGKLAGKMGRRVLPDFLDVVDDPSLSTWSGGELVGGYRVDDDGVPGERVQLVDDGKLTGLLMSRIPTKKVERSNGHGRTEIGFVVGRMSNLLVEPEKTSTEEELLQELRAMCTDFDLDYGLVVEKVSAPGTANLGRSYFMFGQMGSSPKLLSDPVRVYKVDVSTGKKELVRGWEFSSVTLRSMRDIVAAGSEAYVHNFRSSMTPWGAGVPTSIVSPSILVEEMELKKVSGETPRPPILANPFFD